MHRDDNASVSAGDSQSTWRFSHTTKRSTSKRPDPQKRSDLGSDDEWQLTMGSDSDVDEAEASVSNPPSTQSSGRDPLAVQWHDADEESFVDDVKESKIPRAPQPPQSHLAVKQPVYASTNDPSADSIITGFNASLHVSGSDPVRTRHSSADKPSTPPQRPMSDEYDVNSDDQPVMIPGYRGVNSRAAITNPHETRQRTATWADRPRGNPVPLVSSQPTTDNTSGQSSPGLIQTPNRVESDSGPSSRGGSAGSGNALHAPTRTSSDDSDGSRRMTAKSVSFVAQPADTSSKSSPKSSLQTDSDPVSPPTISTPECSVKSSVSLKSGERKTTGILSTLRDGKARLTTARLAASKRPHRRTFTAQNSPRQDTWINTSPSVITNESDPTVPTALRSIPQHLLRESNATRTLSNQRLSTKSDGGFPRQNSELSQAAGRGGRPLSTPSHLSSSSFLDSPVTSQAATVTGTTGSAFASSSPGPSALPTLSRRRGFHLTNTPTKDLSFLECVVEILKGTTAYRRKSLLNVIEVQMWLTSDMQAVQYRVSKKGHLPVTHTLTLVRVRKLKGVERELIIEMIDQKKSLDFLFQSKERADMWLSALCCLIPSHATVKSRHRKLELRETYDPLTDTWNGKTLASRKKLNEFILLGSIGKGSFGKVKLALSTEDRQFYAVKVILKSMIRRRMRKIPPDKSIRDGASSSRLTIRDVNEIVVMKALDHENVMRMKGVFDHAEEDRLYLVVEFLAKGPILNSSSLTAADRISEDRARTAFVDVLCGLQYLHSNNIVHRDIKPDNLLQAGDGTVKISDFGAAVLYMGDDRRDTDEGQCHGSNVGTPAFSAPEVCLSEKSPPRPARGYAADIWSLGATLFYMVYGRAPFIAANVFMMYDAICTQDLVFPDTPVVSEHLQPLLQKMLKKSPEERATIASIIRSPWLTENAGVADKLAKIRSALLEQPNGNDDERRRGLTTNRPVPEVAGMKGRVGSKMPPS